MDARNWCELHDCSRSFQSFSPSLSPPLSMCVCVCVVFAVNEFSNSKHTYSTVYIWCDHVIRNHFQCHNFVHRRAREREGEFVSPSLLNYQCASSIQLFFTSQWTNYFESSNLSLTLARWSVCSSTCVVCKSVCRIGYRAIQYTGFSFFHSFFVCFFLLLLFTVWSMDLYLQDEREQRKNDWKLKYAKKKFYFFLCRIENEQLYVNFNNPV